MNSKQNQEAESLKRHRYADGHYWNECWNCGGTFMGDKLARCCKGCAKAKVKAALQTVEPVDVERKLKPNAVNAYFKGKFFARNQGKTHTSEIIGWTIDHLHAQGYLTTKANQDE